MEINSNSMENLHLELDMNCPQNKCQSAIILDTAVPYVPHKLALHVQFFSAPCRADALLEVATVSKQGSIRPLKPNISNG